MEELLVFVIAEFLNRGVIQKFEDNIAELATYAGACFFLIVHALIFHKFINFLMNLSNFNLFYSQISAYFESQMQ